MSHVPPQKRHPYDQWSPDARALDLVGDKWTLLIVRDLVSGPRRFVELQRVLPGISTEQLRSRLNRMVADGMLTRKRYREVPPRVDYELTDRARELIPVLGELARWGYEWAWGAPRAGERVDVGAILRLIPGLVAPGSAGSGTVELVVAQEGRDESARYLVTLGEGRPQVIERGGEGSAGADATVTGTVQEWVAALSPPGDGHSLRIGGRRELADSLLAALRPGEGSRVPSAADAAG